MASQLIKLALVNPDNEVSEKLVFSVVQDGVSEATRQVVSIEPDSITIEDEQTLHTSKLYNLTVAGVFSSSAKSQLRTWSSARTELVMVGYGLDGHILYATGPINVDESYDTHLSFYFTSPRRAVGNYLSDSSGAHSAGMIYDKNGLSYHKWNQYTGGWAGDGSWSSPSLVLLDTDLAYKEIYWPFTEPITFSVNVDSYTGNPVIRINESDGAGGSILTSTTITGTGRKVVSVTPDSSTLRVRLEVETDADDEISFSYPALNTGVKTSSTAIFSEFNS